MMKIFSNYGFIYMPLLIIELVMIIITTAKHGITTPAFFRYTNLKESKGKSEQCNI
jgi:hypothetical protein